MVKIRNAFVFASVVLVAAVSASTEVVTRRALQAVSFRQDLLDAINALRKTEDLEELCINELLMCSAQEHANDMNDNNFFSSRGSHGSTPKQRANDVGFMAKHVTEVIGTGHRTALEITAAWANASSVKNTLLGNHTVMGPGYVYDTTKVPVHFWVVDFSDGECGKTTPPNSSNRGTKPTVADQESPPSENRKTGEKAGTPLSFANLETSKTPSSGAPPAPPTPPSGTEAETPSSSADPETSESPSS